jgi:hypothetical protein
MTMSKVILLSVALWLIQPLFVGQAAHAVGSPPTCQPNTACPGNALYVGNAGTYQSQSATTTACGNNVNNPNVYFPGVNVKVVSTGGTLNATPTSGSGACLTFTVTAPGPFTVNAAGSAIISGKAYSAQWEITGTWDYPASSGALKLKYQVLGVDYAPPGAKSTVNYSGTTMQGTSTSNSFTWNNKTTVTVTASTKEKFLIFGGGGSLAASGSYEQEADDSNSITISNTTGMSDIVLGPASSAAGIDHDYDVIWVWLNPELELAIPAPYQIQWSGYTYDAQDDAQEMEVKSLFVWQLKNPSLLPAGLASRLARSWDTSGLGGLTAADYTAILAADPFVANPAFDPNTDTSGRYDLQIGEALNYDPAPPGGQPVTQTYSVMSQTTTSAGKGSSDTRSVGATVDLNFGASINLSIFSASFALDVKTSDTYTSMNKWSQSNNGGSGQTATLSITGPASTDNYQGPTTIQVWKDNVYGTFMFYPVE